MEPRKRRPLAIDKAPGKELIPLIVNKKSFDDLFTFYKGRVDWHEYPLIHDMFYTFGLFEDLFDVLPNDNETIGIFLEFALEIAEKETDERFISASFLVLDCCQTASKEWIPTDDTGRRIANLKPRIEKLKKVNNLVGFWDQIIKICSRNKNFSRM